MGFSGLRELGRPGASAAAAACRGVAWDEPVVVCVGEDHVQGGSPNLDAGAGVALAVRPLPRIDVLAVDHGEWGVSEFR